MSIKPYAITVSSQPETAPFSSRRRFLALGLTAVAAPLVVAACSSSCYSKSGNAGASCQARISEEQRTRILNRPPGR